MQVFVCVGSSCHLKGSYDIIQELQNLVKEHHLEDKVTLNASFCLGHCTEGVAVRIEDEYIEGVSRESIETFFQKHILERM